MATPGQLDRRLEGLLSRWLTYKAGKLVLAVSWELGWCHGPKASVPLHMASPWTVRSYLQYGDCFQGRVAPENKEEMCGTCMV